MKTEKSRRTLGLPQMAVDALVGHRKRQAGERLAVGVQLVDHDLVFAARTSAPLQAANVRGSPYPVRTYSVYARRLCITGL